MKEVAFDAVVDFSPPHLLMPFPVVLAVEGRRVPATIAFYEIEETGKPGEYLVHVSPQCPLDLKRGDSFEVAEGGGQEALGNGMVLNPFSSMVRGKKERKRVEFLRRLQGDEKGVLYALTQERGIKGLREDEILSLVRVSKTALGRLSEEIEKEGKVRILSFSPLFLIWRQSLSFLQEKILSYLEQFHTKHPLERGVSKEKIKERFGLHQKVLSLALEYLVKKGKVERIGELIALSTFKMTPSPDEERILKQLEEMCFKGEFQSVSQEDMQRAFHLPPERLAALLSLLVERKNIVLGKEGFFIHSRWLEEIVSQVKKSRRKGLTVSDFKEMTGLTRKYAIPLLELLDQMGVTRRVTPSRREII